MKRLLNTLYVTTEGAYLKPQRETVVVKKDGASLLQVPVHLLGSIVCFGKAGVSPGLLRLAAKHGVSVSFLSAGGRFLARMEGPVSGNVLVRRAQYRRADDSPGSAEIARAVVLAKVLNSRTSLQRSLRDRPEHERAGEVRAAADHLGALTREIERASEVDRIRGFEGEAARTYFAVFDALLTAPKEEFSFTGRNRRPPLDKVNALLSFLYTLLHHDAASALETVGLDPAVGFLHRDRPGRKSLALDLMEELRPVLADRLALSLINRRQVTGAGFEVTESGAVSMDEATRKTVLVEYQKRKQAEIEHPFLGESVPWGLVLHLQANLLARFFRGETDGYPPFIWR